MALRSAGSGAGTGAPGSPVDEVLEPGADLEPDQGRLPNDEDMCIFTRRSTRRCTCKDGAACGGADCLPPHGPSLRVPRARTKTHGRNFVTPRS